MFLGQLALNCAPAALLLRLPALPAVLIGVAMPSRAWCAIPPPGRLMCSKDPAVNALMAQEVQLTEERPRHSSSPYIPYHG